MRLGFHVIHQESWQKMNSLHGITIVSSKLLKGANTEKQEKLCEDSYLKEEL